MVYFCQGTNISLVKTDSRLGVECLDSVIPPGNSMMLSSARRGIREDPDLQSASHVLRSQALISAGSMTGYFPSLGYQVRSALSGFGVGSHQLDLPGVTAKPAQPVYCCIMVTRCDRCGFEVKYLDVNAGELRGDVECGVFQLLVFQPTLLYQTSTVTLLLLQALSYQSA